MRREFGGDDVVSFATELGWMSVLLRGEVIRRLSFGHASSAIAVGAIAPGQSASRRLSDWQRELVERLRAYADGAPLDFSDYSVDCGVTTVFQSDVLNACRRIPYGQTATYGDLARTADSPRAARAIGNCMAGNRVPLIIPCHRVVRAGGNIGRYSGAEGCATKQRLLDMEAANALAVLKPMGKPLARAS